MLIFTIAAAFLVCVHGAAQSPPMVNERVVAGIPGEIAKFPYLVSMLYDELLTDNFKHVCGGAIIRVDVVITAANCTYGRVRQAAQYRIRAGSNFHNAGGQIRKVSRIVQHEKYLTNGNHDSDISLLYLEAELTLGPTVAIITLPVLNENVLDNSPAVVSGWGLGSNLKPDNFNMASVNTFNHGLCVSYLSPINPVTDNMICAIGLHNQGPCDGDEGGPLATRNNVLIGITSWRNKNVMCGDYDYPAVYTKVSKFRNWIEENMYVFLKHYLIMLFLIIAAASLVCTHGAVLPPVPEVNERIVGGTTGYLPDFPYLVALLYDEFITEHFFHICGGSIISKNVILTAASCFEGRSHKPEQYRIRVGTIYHNAGEVDKISRILQHREFNSRYDNDICLVFLTDPLIFGPNVAVIELPYQDQNFPDNTDARASGWGVIEGDVKPDRFYEVYVQTYNQFQCISSLFNINPVTDSMICARGFNGGSACDGDDGGPLVVRNVQIGITSWRNMNAVCGHPQYPGVYTRVSKFVNWIKENIKMYTEKGWLCSNVESPTVEDSFDINKETCDTSLFAQFTYTQNEEKEEEEEEEDQEENQEEEQEEVFEGYESDE
ncbi:transmembrane protease serine 9-like [Arctopsyche grandis]|uniref:transmembrane protease serine 9-like n=1 Tax=Arctopsyche grandis TaxID=121162 RepID=UPI00406D80C9